MATSDECRNRTNIVYADAAEREAVLALVRDSGLVHEIVEGWDPGWHVSGMGNVIVDFQDPNYTRKFVRKIPYYDHPDGSLKGRRLSEKLRPGYDAPTGETTPARRM